MTVAGDTCTKTFRSVTLFTLGSLGDGLNLERPRHGEGGHTSGGGKVDAAAWLHDLGCSSTSPRSKRARSLSCAK
jgi:hypothetical protein